jgi:hypothetical protein
MSVFRRATPERLSAFSDGAEAAASAVEELLAASGGGKQGRPGARCGGVIARQPVPAPAASSPLA